MSEAAAPQAALHIPGLDGLRAVSILLVFFDHAGLERFASGDLGVTVFFFLSGFLITTMLRRERERTGAVSLRRFYLRRALRIWPPFYLVLGLAVLGAALGAYPAPLDPATIAAQALHVSNYALYLFGTSRTIPGTAVFWSLAVEEHFYLVFPLLLALLVRLGLSRERQAGVLWGLCAAALAWRVMLVFGWHADHHRTWLCTDTRFDALLMGCALALRGNPVLDAPTGSDSLWKWVLLPAGLAALTFTLVVQPDGWRDSLWYTLQSAALVPLFVCAVRFPRWAPLRWLNAPTIAMLGTISYSLYLLHLLVMFALRAQLPSLAWSQTATLALPVSIALSLASYVTVERPFAALRRRLNA